MYHPQRTEPLNITLNDREQIQYLLGNPPTWMMRYGITVMAGLFTILLALSYVIHYPDTVTGKVVLTTSNPPIRIIAKSSGKVSELLVKDKEEVHSGQVLAVLENTANWHDVLALEHWLADTRRGDVPEGLALGDLQSIYAPLVQHWHDKQYFDRNNGVSEKIAHLQRQISDIQQIKSSQSKQIDNFRNDYELALKGIQRQRALNREKVISERELEAAEIDFLGHKRQLESAVTALFQNELQIKQLHAQIQNLQQGMSDDGHAKTLAVSAGLQQLGSAIAAWKQTYLVTAPIDGVVAYSTIWSPQQNLDAGEEVMAIVPAHFPNAASLLGKVQLPLSDAGKVALGQKAILKLDGYPEQEYGVVAAIVANLSILPQQQEKEPVYLLDLQLPDLLRTNQGREVPFRQEMGGEVRIITEDRRVVERIFGQLRALL